MSKEKTPKLKRKTTGLDVVSRIITCGLAVAIPAAAYFLSMIYYEFQSTAIALISKFTGGAEGDDGTTYGYATIKGVVEFVRNSAGNSDKSASTAAELWAAVEPLHKAIYATGIVFALTLLIAVIIFFVSAFSNSNKIPLILGVVGIAGCAGMAIAFRAITAPIIDGSFQLSASVLNVLLSGMFGGSDIMSAIGSLIGSVADSIVKFTVINLSTAWVTMIICFLLIVVWQGAVLLVNLGDKSKNMKIKE